MNQQMEGFLRELFSERDKAQDNERRLRNEIEDTIKKQIADHGAHNVVKWLRSKSTAFPERGYPADKYSLFDDVLGVCHRPHKKDGGNLFSALADADDSAPPHLVG